MKTAHFTQKTKTRAAVLTIREGYGLNGSTGRVVAEIQLQNGKREAKQQAAAHAAKPWDF